MKVELLTQADQVLSPCGRYVAPAGLGWVDIPFGMQYQKYLANAAADSTEEKLVETPVPFILRAFQAFAQPGTIGAVYWRMRFPTGRFFQSQICAVSEEFDFGSFRQPIDPPLECAPGSRFYFTTDGLIASGTDVAITVLLEGVLRYTIKGTSGCAIPIGRNEPWASQPAFPVHDPNQNILAPECRLGGQCYPETPKGYRDEPFTYCVPLSNAVSVKNDGSVTANQPLLIGSDADFVVRGLNFVFTAVGGATGTLFVRIRSDSGYEITDGFCTAARISTVLFPELWLKSSGRGASALFIDYMFVDNNATGSWNVQPVAIGVKRRRVSA